MSSMTGWTRRDLGTLAGSLLVAPVLPARSQTPTPPTAAELFAPRSFGAAVLSPDGRRVAFTLRVKDAEPSLMVLDLATMVTTPLASFDGVGVGHVHWVNNERLVFDLAAWLLPGSERHLNPGLFAVNIDGSRFVPLVETRGSWLKGPSTRELLPQWTLLLQTTAAQDSPDVWVVVAEAYNAKVGVDYQRLHRLNTLTGRSDLIELPLHAAHWVIDGQDQVRALLTLHEGVTSLMWRDAGQAAWRTLARFDGLQRQLAPVRVETDGTLWVATADKGDTVGVYAWDFAKGEVSSRALAVSPDYDLAPGFVEQQGRLIGLRVTTDAGVTQWIDPAMTALQATVDRLLPSTANTLSVATRADSPQVLIHSQSDTQPGSSLIYHRETGKLQRLGDALPALRGKPMAAMDLLHYPARDGLSIPAYLSLPPGRPAKALPLVVWVHGGPWVRGTDWHWQPEVQFLATRGYAVLQPEFRGSTGFGRKHFEAGWKQWGRAMQDDLADAAKWAVDKGIADPRRICILGASYGGYAALMGLVRHPELFRCAVQWVGVTDPMLLYDIGWSDITEAAKTHGMPRLLGDRVQDAALLAQISPLKNAERIKAPLLMAYGAKDERVPLVHGEKLREALRPHNSQVEWVVYPDERHGWLAAATKIDFWHRVEAFLARHLVDK